MVSTTRSRGAPPPTSSNDGGLNSKETTPTGAIKQSKSTNDKVYRKAPPKLELQQLQFPAKRKTVRVKKMRHSLPIPTSSAARKGRTKGKKKEDDEDLKQKTLTQMRWTDMVPSTFRSDDEGLDDMDHEAERLVVDLTADDNGEAASAPSTSTVTSTTKKKKVEVKQPAKGSKITNRSRKRRKTTGDLELELEPESHEGEEAVSSSKYYTQTLTQMPSWREQAEIMVGDSDEELGFGFDDDLSGEVFDGATPPSKKRKRPLPMPEPGDEAEQHALPRHPESTAASMVPETPSLQRATRTEIPSSQPSPFTPNLDLGARYWSPLGVNGVDRTPLRERSTNMDATSPTVRKRRRSEIPDSWSTVNGGMPPSSEAKNSKRVPLKEIPFTDESVELGDDDREDDTDTGGHDCNNASQKSRTTADDVIMDSADELDGFPDDYIEAPGTSTSPKQALGQHSETQAIFKQIADETNVGGADGPTPLELDTTPGTLSLPVVTTLTRTEEQCVRVMSTDAAEVVSSTPIEQITAPEEVTSNGLRPDIHSQEGQVEIVELDAEEVVTPTPSFREPGTQHPSYHHVATHPSQTIRPTAENEVATPTQTVRGIATQSPYSCHVTARKSTPEIVAEADETEPETPSHTSRRPSSSSAVEKETPFSSPQKTSPAMLPISQLGYKSQAFESQRVPFEAIQQMAPQTDRSDVIVSASPDEVKHIIDGTYTHIFRDFRIPKNVARIWIYITTPVCQLKYMAAISDWKMPGDIKPQDAGLGVAEFNANESTKYANELLQVYQLNNPVSLERMKEDGWVEQAPLATGYKYVPPAPLGALMGNLRCALFEEHSDEGQSQSQSQGTVTISQELADQLRSDIEHSTQLMRRRLTSSPRKQRRPPRHAEEQHDDEQLLIHSSQDAMEARIRATPVRTKFRSEKQVVFAKPEAPEPAGSQDSMVQIDDSPPAMRHSSQQSQRIIKSTVRPSQATTMSVPSQSQRRERAAEYCTIPDSPSPARPSAGRKSSNSLPMAMDDSPIRLQMTTSSGHGDYTLSSLGLGALLGSSQGSGLVGIGGEQDSLMDDSRIRMPPTADDVVWDSEVE